MLLRMDTDHLERPLLESLSKHAPTKEEASVVAMNMHAVSLFVSQLVLISSLLLHPRLCVWVREFFTGSSLLADGVHPHFFLFLLSHR